MAGKGADALKPHILVVSQYFYPENFRINDIAAEWVKRGYQVTVLTGIPNYPGGKFFKGYGYRRRRHEFWRGVEVVRIPLLPRGASCVGLAFNYISFAVSGFFWNLAGRIQADLVFTFEVSPMTQALIGCWYRNKHHVPHFLYVQDLWPENVEAVAGVTNPFVIWPIHKMVDYIYKNSDQIFAPSHAFVESIAHRGVVPRGKVHYWPQYAEAFYRPLQKSWILKQAGRRPYLHQVSKGHAFKIAFTGNIGAAQGLDILPEAAGLLKNVNARFVIVGDGRYRTQLEEEIRKRGVEDKFLMVPRQKPQAVPQILAFCDAAFLSLRDTQLLAKTVPAKLPSYMACGMPVIAAANGETKRLVGKAACGICVGIGDAKALADAVEWMMGHPAELAEMGQNSFRYYKAWFQKAGLMDEMERYFAQALDIRPKGHGKGNL